MYFCGEFIITDFFFLCFFFYALLQKNVEIFFLYPNIYYRAFFPKGKKMGQNPKILPQILVPLAGLEPARSLDRGILSPLRLPIPPQRRVNVKFFVRNSQNWL